MKENPAQVRIFTGTLDGKQIAFSSETIFFIQVGKGTRGAYQTKSTAKGDLGEAIRLYTGLCVSGGYKKRLIMGGSNSNRPLARYQS